MIGFLSSFLDLYTVLPIRLATAKHSYPVKKGVLNVFEKGKVMSQEFFPFIIVVKSPFCHHDLVSIFII
jgi:hypothetical protein